MTYSRRQEISRFDGLSTGMDTVWDLLLPKDKYEISRFAAKKVNIAGQLRDEHGGIKSAEYFVSAEDAIIDVDSIRRLTGRHLTALMRMAPSVNR